MDEANMGTKKWALPVAIVLTSIIGAAVILWPRPSPAQRGLSNLIDSLQSGSPPSGVYLFDGPNPLPFEVTEKIFDRVLSPNFRRLRSKPVTFKRSEGKMTSVFWEVISKNGNPYLFVVNGFDRSDGVALQLRRMLENVWEFSKQQEMSRKLTTEEKWRWLAQCARRDQRTLNELGMSELFGPLGTRVTWNQLADHYDKLAADRTAK